MLYLVYKLFKILFGKVEKKICECKCLCCHDYVCYTCEDKWNNS